MQLSFLVGLLILAPLKPIPSGDHRLEFPPIREGQRPMFLYQEPVPPKIEVRQPTIEVLDIGEINPHRVPTKPRRFR